MRRRDQPGALVTTTHVHKCGHCFCDLCGDCLVCFGEDLCVHSRDGRHAGCGCRTVGVNISEEYDVLVDRTTIWGNPFFPEHDGGRARCLQLYREHVLASPDLRSRLEELIGQRLACHCPRGRACHRDVLVELAELCHQGRLP